MKINFSNQTVSIAAALSFTSMAALEDLLQTGAMEAVEAGDAEKATAIFELAESFGIDFDDIDLVGQPTGDILGNDQKGGEGDNGMPHSPHHQESE